MSRSTAEIAQVRQAPQLPGFPKYQQRLFSPLGLWKSSGWNIKAYGIHQDTSRSEADLLDPGVEAAARDHVLARLGEADEEGNHHHCGFAIIHQGLLANWLLFNWWVHGVICCEGLSRSPVDNPTRFEAHTGPMVACIWEMVVIEHEKRSWIDHVLKDGGHLEAYLDAWLRPGLY
jgi:hypothetical protein